MRYFLFLALVVMLVSGCAKPIQIDLKATQVAKPDLILPKTDILTMRKVDWILVTPNNTTEAFNEIAKKGRPAVLFSTTDEGYENIAKNFSDIRLLIQQQRAIIKAYETYYFESLKAINYANDEIDKAHQQVDKVNAEANQPNMWEKFKDKFTTKTDKVIDAIKE